MQPHPNKTGPCGVYDSIDDYPWFGHDNNEPPPRTDFFGPSDDLHVSYGRRLRLESFFQHNGVFINGVRGTPCHMDSYMTCVDFGALDRCLALLDEQYEPAAEDWSAAVNMWVNGINMQPPSRIVGLIIANRYHVDVAE